MGLSPPFVFFCRSDYSPSQSLTVCSTWARDQSLWDGLLRVAPVRIIIRRYFQVSAFEDQWYFFAFLMMALMLREGFCLEAGFDTPNSYATALAEKEQYLVNKGLR
jgi:hypothetical protein